MSQRERWVVYPLLFLALGLALRDKLVPSRLKAWSLDAAIVRCDQLEVLDGEGNPRVRLGVVGRGGQVELDTPEGQTTLVLGTDGDQLRYGLFALRPGWKRLVPLSLYDMPPLVPEGKDQPAPAKRDPPTGDEGAPTSAESPRPPGKAKTQ